jgi:hypothetical protein
VGEAERIGGGSQAISIFLRLGLWSDVEDEQYLALKRN